MKRRNAQFSGLNHLDKCFSSWFFKIETILSKINYTKCLNNEKQHFVDHSKNTLVSQWREHCLSLAETLDLNFFDVFIRFVMKSSNSLSGNII